MIQLCMSLLQSFFCLIQFCIFIPVFCLHDAAVYVFTGQTDKQVGRQTDKKKQTLPERMNYQNNPHLSLSLSLSLSLPSPPPSLSLSPPSPLSLMSTNHTNSSVRLKTSTSIYWFLVTWLTQPLPLHTQNMNGKETLIRVEADAAGPSDKKRKVGPVLSVLVVRNEHLGPDAWCCAKGTCQIKGYKNPELYIFLNNALLISTTICFMFLKIQATFHGSFYCKYLSF